MFAYVIISQCTYERFEQIRDELWMGENGLVSAGYSPALQTTRLVFEDLEIVPAQLQQYISPKGQEMLTRQAEDEIRFAEAEANRDKTAPESPPPDEVYYPPEGS